jgi:hypothetical protein
MKKRLEYEGDLDAILKSFWMIPKSGLLGLMLTSLVKIPGFKCTLGVPMPFILARTHFREKDARTTYAIEENSDRRDMFISMPSYNVDEDTKKPKEKGYNSTSRCATGEKICASSMNDWAICVAKFATKYVPSAGRIHTIVKANLNKDLHLVLPSPLETL